LTSVAVLLDTVTNKRLKKAYRVLLSIGTRVAVGIMVVPVEIEFEDSVVVNVDVIVYEDVEHDAESEGEGYDHVGVTMVDAEGMYTG
jgi:hypothetical protein